MNYIMGSTGHSFVTNWGFNPPEKPHHRGASCGYVLLQENCNSDVWYARDTEAFPNVLTGALVGGPNLYDEWKDSNLDYVASEVALDYNAGLLSGGRPCSLHVSGAWCMPLHPLPLYLLGRRSSRMSSVIQNSILNDRLRAQHCSLLPGSMRHELDM